MASNKDNAQDWRYAQNMLDSLRIQLIQFTDQQKVAKSVANKLKLMFLYMAVPDILTDQTCSIY